MSLISGTRSLCVWICFCCSRTFGVFFARELPVDSDSVAVHCPVPCPCLPLQLSDRWDSVPPQTLAEEQADLDLRLVQPAAAFCGQ